MVYDYFIELHGDEPIGSFEDIEPYLKQLENTLGYSAYVLRITQRNLNYILSKQLTSIYSNMVNFLGGDYEC